MIVRINLFGARCKKCEELFFPKDRVSIKIYATIEQNGDLNLSSGYMDIFCKKCKED